MYEFEYKNSISEYKNVITTASTTRFTNVLINTLHPTNRELNEYEQLTGRDFTDPARSLEAVVSAIELINVEPAIIYVFTSVPPNVQPDTINHLYSHLQSQNIQVRVILCK